jgi:predicted nuclease with TOPRIM domain
MCEAWHMPSDEQIESQIEELESEREELRQREGPADPTLDQDAARLEEIRVDLDRLWDLLRQRRALRSAGEDPDLASERSAETVEKYWQ